MQRGRLRELDAISSKSTSGVLNWAGTSVPAWKTTSSSIRIVSPVATASWLRASHDCVLVLGDIQQALWKHVKSYNCRQNRSERRKKRGELCSQNHLVASENQSAQSRSQVRLAQRSNGMISSFSE